MLLSSLRIAPGATPLASIGSAQLPDGAHELAAGVWTTPTHVYYSPGQGALALRVHGAMTRAAEAALAGARHG